MTKLWRMICAGIIVAVPAHADNFCARLETLNVMVAQSTPNFILPEQAGAAKGCRTSLSQNGGRSLHCIWSFDYRVPAATRTFDTLLEKVGRCTEQVATQDKSVNHPDFYDLHLFKFENVNISVSLKDKGALQQTLVFLTVTRP